MNYELIEQFISTLFYSWGGDAPAEATWAANDFLKILEDQYQYTFKEEFSESYNDEKPDHNRDVVMAEIKKLINSKS